MNKVAQVTFCFWIMKICATTLGETAGDLLSMTMDVGYAMSSAILLGLFLVSLVSQVRAKEFHPVLYWTVILTTSTAGTTMSDFMDRSLGLGYAKGTLILMGLLIAVLAAWRWSPSRMSAPGSQEWRRSHTMCASSIGRCRANTSQAPPARTSSPKR